MRAQHPLVVVMRALARRVQRSPGTFRSAPTWPTLSISPGPLLNLRPTPGPEAVSALNASFPAAAYSSDQASAGKQVYGTCTATHRPIRRCHVLQCMEEPAAVRSLLAHQQHHARGPAEN